MNLLIKYLLILLFIISTLSADFNLEEQKFIKNHPIINVGVEKDWPPFDFVENGKFTGLAKDYLELIEKKTNLKFNYLIDSWENLLEKAKNKELDLLPILSKDANREKFLLFTEKYLTIRDYIYAKSSRKDIRSDKDFKGKTIAITKGYVQADYFKKNYPNTKIYLTNDILETIDAVITNKADFLVANNAIMNYLLNKYNISQMNAIFNLDYNGSDLHMAVRNDYPILRDIIQKALNAINTNEKNSIHSKWINPKNTNNVKKSLQLTNEEISYLKRKKTIKIANEFDWKPFDFFEDGQAKGYVIDYIKLISKKLSLEPIFITDKWSFLIEKMKKSEIDILPVLGYNEKRKEYLNFTQDFMTQKFSIVTKFYTNDIVNIDDLIKKKVGMVKGWNSTSFLIKNYPSMNIIEFESQEDIYNAIKDNFIDATIQNKLLANYFVNKNYYKVLKVGTDISINGFSGKLFMGTKKDDLILNNILKKAINSVTEKELAILEDKWINISNKIVFTKKEQEFMNNNVIKITTSNNWAPFNFFEDNKYHGINADYLAYILNHSKLKTKLTISDKYLEIVEGLKNKSTDLVISGNKTKDSEKYAIFTDIINSYPFGIATLYDKNYIKHESELINKSIGVIKNSSSYSILREKYPNMNFIFVENSKDGLNLLSENKIYAFIDVMPVLSYNIKYFGFSNIKISGQTTFDFNLRFMIRDDYPILKSIINKILNKMPIEEKQKIIDKWIKISLVEKSDYSLLWKMVLFFLIILFFMLYKNRQMRNYQVKLEDSQKETEKSLKNFKTLIDLNIAGILIIRDKKIKYLNNEAINILKYESKSELINKEVSSIFNIKGIDELCELLDEDNSCEINAIKEDKTLIPILIKGKKTEFDNLPSHIISIINLTEIKNKEKLLQEQSKLASLGEMIGNIAHQWRQPLSAISTTASGIKLQKEYGILNNENFYEAMDTITETSKFLSKTIDDFKDYIKDTKEKKYFNIKPSVERVLSIMKGSFTNNFIKIENNIEDLRINNYENEFTQVLLNILSNSKDALINIKEKDRKIYISSSKKENNFILNIIDTGGGIPSYIMDKIYEPYFTTKHKSQGTGLGLYMTHKMIKESMNANISIENCVYKNYEHCTKVSLTIPID